MAILQNKKRREREKERERERQTETEREHLYDLLKKSLVKIRPVVKMYIHQSRPAIKNTQDRIANGIYRKDTHKR